MAPPSFAMLMQCLKLITIEPLMFLHAAAQEVTNLISANSIFDKLCRASVASSTVGLSCSNKRTLPADVVQAIQAGVNQWTAIIAGCVIVVVFAVTPLYGAFSDKHGRKTVVLVALVGIIVSAFAFLLMLSIRGFSLVSFAIVLAVLALTGGMGTFQSIALAYVADREPDPSRLTIRYTIIQTMQYVAEIIVDFALAAALLNSLSIVTTAVLPIAFGTAAFFYVLLFMVEKPPRLCRAFKQAALNKSALELQVKAGEVDAPGVRPEMTTTITQEPQPAKSVRPSLLDLCKLLQEAAWAIRRPREGHFRAYIWVIIVVAVLCSFAGFGGGVIFRVYILGAPLYWTLSEQATFLGIQAASRLIGGLLTGIGLKLIFKFHESTLMLIAIGSQFFSHLLVGVATNGALVYASAVVGFATSMLSVAGRSILTQFVDVDETGKVFAIFIIVVSVSVLVGLAGLTSLFSATFKLYPGFVFLFLAGIELVSFLAMLWVHVDYWQYRKTARGRTI